MPQNALHDVLIMEIAHVMRAFRSSFFNDYIWMCSYFSSWIYLNTKRYPCSMFMAVNRSNGSSSKLTAIVFSPSGPFYSYCDDKTHTKKMSHSNSQLMEQWISIKRCPLTFPTR